MERLKGGHSCVCLTWINVCGDGSNTNSAISCDILQVSADDILFFGLDRKNNPVTLQKIRQKV